MNKISDSFWSLAPGELLRQLNTAPQGLTNGDAKQRLSQFGENRLKPRKRLNVLSLFVSQFKSPIILILIFAAGLSSFLHDPTDALIILGIIILFSRIKLQTPVWRCSGYPDEESSDKMGA